MRLVRWLAALALLAVTLMSAGCGVGLTGGSIPPGGTRAHGLVVRGDSASIPLAGAVIRFQPVTVARATRFTTGGGNTDPPDPPYTGGGNSGGPIVVTPEVPGTVKATANDAGEFDLPALPVGDVHLIVTPPSASGLATLVTQLTVTAGDSYYIVAAPLPAGLSTAGLTGIEVNPPSVQLTVGEAVQMDVRLLGGAPPAVVPTYLLRGDVGVVNSHGRLTGVRQGSGLLRVIVGPFEQAVPVAVSPVP